MKNLSDSIFTSTIVGMILGIPVLLGIVILSIPFLVISCITNIPMDVLLKNLAVFVIAVFLVWLFSRYQIIENGLVGFIVGLLVYKNFQWHSLICILIGIGITGLLFFVSYIKIGFWIKTILFSVIVTFLVFAFIYSDAGLLPLPDMIWKISFVVIFFLENIFIRCAIAYNSGSLFDVRVSSKEKENQNIENHPSDYYYLKNSCMNPNESRVFYYLNCILDEFFKGKRREDFFVFPQVSLYTFININSNIEQNHVAKYIALQKLAKNVDFIICQRYKDDSYYLYRPILLIEIDGESHRSTTPFGEKSLSKQQKTDAFKNSISSALGLPLFRYRHDTSIMHDDRDKIKDELYHYFQQMNIL